MADKFWRNTYLQLPNTHRAVGPLTKDWSLSYRLCEAMGGVKATLSIVSLYGGVTVGDSAKRSDDLRNLYFQSICGNVGIHVAEVASRDMRRLG